MSIKISSFLLWEFSYLSSLKMSTASIDFWSAKMSLSSQHFSETSVWADPDSTLPMFGFIVYVFVIPIICGTGFVTNLMNIIVFARPKLLSASCSSYFYFICKFKNISLEYNDTNCKFHIPEFYMTNM